MGRGEKRERANLSARRDATQHLQVLWAVGAVTQGTLGSRKVFRIVLLVLAFLMYSPPEH